MARILSNSLPPISPEATVRAHFGLSQDDLGRYLGISREQVAHLEANRRRPAQLVDERLVRLARLLPPPAGYGPAAPRFAVPKVPPPVAPLVVPDLGGTLADQPLRRRLLQVQAQASGLRLALHQAGKGAVLQQRREWGLAQLQAALPPADVTDTAELSHISRWLTVLAADVLGDASTPATRAAQVLTMLRVQALEAEATTLARLLETPATPSPG